MTRGAFGGWLLALLASTTLAGCGRSTVPGTVAASGVVTLDAKPLEGASVTFQPIGGDAKLASQSTTDAAGKFELGTYAGGGKFQPGIAPGKYAVSIIKLDTASIRNTLSPPKNLLPVKYANPDSSKLTAEVTAGKENNFEFPLSSK
jgi:hypothetical protein